MLLKLISCDIFEREVRAVAARSSNRVQVECLSKPPHQLSDTEMLRSLQLVVNRARRGRYQAVLMMAGSCKHGLSGLRAGSVPLVLPRARDCISLLLEPVSTPWPLIRQPVSRSAERGGSASPAPSPVWPQLESASSAVKSSLLRACRGAERDVFTDSWNWRVHLRGQFPPPVRPERRRLSILEMLVEGYWNYSDFLVVPPGWHVRVDHDQGSIAAEELPQ